MAASESAAVPAATVMLEEGEGVVAALEAATERAA